jgi:superfamily II DNA or RNA helicase
VNGYVLVNIQVLTEGWDCPRAKCIIAARPTASPRLWNQMTGRCVRPYLHRGKSVKPIILDHSGSCLAVDLPLVDVEYSLDMKPPKQLKNRKVPACKVCRGCGFACKRGVETCEQCGEAFPVEIVETHSGDLVLANGPRMCVGYGTEPCPKDAVAGRYSKHSRCNTCARRHYQASRTPEQRSEWVRKVSASLTPEQRSEKARKANASRTPEQRSEMARKAWETRRQQRV